MMDEAITEMKNAARIDPQNEQAHYALGVIYIKKGIVEEAVKELQKALEINPRNAKAREMLEQIQMVEDGSLMAL